MAKSPAIKDGATYRVVLAKSIRVGRRIVHPGPNLKLSGAALKAAKAADVAAVASYEQA